VTSHLVLVVGRRFEHPMTTLVCHVHTFMFADVVFASRVHVFVIDWLCK
jgi:hypothetical protein